MKNIYDIAVIGAGLIGSAAAKYLAQNEHKTLLLGQAEPLNKKNHNGVFSSHYDAGRITRVLHTDLLWAKLAKASIANYKNIETETGINFYQAKGCLFIGAADDLEFMQQIRQARDELQVDCRVLPATELVKQFPMIMSTDVQSGIYESAPAGYINPRAMLSAQLTLGKSFGLTHVDCEVKNFSRNEKNLIAIHSSTGTYYAKNIMVSAGNHSNELLPESLSYKNIARTVVMAEIDPKQAHVLLDYPALIYVDDNPYIEYIYLVPPTTYPDGSVRIKIGGAYKNAAPLNDDKQLRDWFRGDGDPIETKALTDILLSLFPKVHFINFSHSPCAYSETASKRPYIGELQANIWVATGGCGMAAKSADEIGSIAASWYTQGQCPQPYRAEDFALLRSALK